MGCCQAKQTKDKSKDEPLLAEHLNTKLKHDREDEAGVDIAKIEKEAPHVANGTLHHDAHKSKTIESNKAEQNVHNPTKTTTATPTNHSIAIEAAPTDDSIEPLAAIEINMNMNTNTNHKKKAKRTQKRDSLIAKSDLKKLDNFTLKMHEKQKQTAVMITVNIKSMETKFPVFKIEVDQNLTVLDLKGKICDNSPDKVAALKQRLIYKGRLLKDHKSLKQYNIQSEQTIMLVRSRRDVSSAANTPTTDNQDRGRARHRAMTMAPELQRSKTPQPQ